MNLRTTLAAAGLLGAGVLSAVALQDEATFTFSAVTEHHGMLEQFAGKWTATVSMFGADATESGTEVNEMIGELWVSSHYTGTFMGMPFEGRSVTGYDPDKQKYVMSWADSFTPTLALGEGTYDEDGKTLTMLVPGKDMATGEEVVQTHINEFVDENTRTLRMLSPVPGNDEPVEMMKIEYKRVP